MNTSARGQYLLRREYLLLARFTAIAAVLIVIFLPKPIWTGSNIADNIWMALAYIFGTVLSALAGKIGIQVATIANMKAAEAAQKGVQPAFMTGFRGGAVMGMAVVGSSLLGVALIFMIIGDATALLGFSFGASSLALFAKAGGGIFTKAADIAADLVGKVELGMEEDDPGTLQLLQTMWVIMWETLPVWVQTFLTPMLRPWLPPWLWQPL